MNRHRTRNLRILAALAAVFLIALAAAPLAALADSQPPTPAEAVQRAWQHARDLGAYDFTTDISAVVYPPATLASIGRPGGKDQLHLEGSVDLPARTMALNLWQGAGSVLNPADGVEVRIEGDQAYGRASGGSWEEINDFSGSFAPGGDLLVYLIGARNVVELGSETVALPVPEGAIDPQSDEGATLAPALLGAFTRYGFDLDGPAVAEEVRQQWQRQLQERGELPAGAQIQAPAELRDATGSGELWVDSQGLPARLTVEIAYPPDENEAGSTGRATIQTDFSGFPAQVAQGSPDWLVDVLHQAGSQAADLKTPLTAAKAAMLLALLSIPLLLIFHSRSRRLYGALALVMIFSMVISPLAESQRAAAFSRQQAAQQAAYEERQEDARARQEAQEAMSTSSWDPHQDPLLAAEQSAAARDMVAQQQGAGLVAPYQVTEQLALEEEPAPESDDDNDHLTYIEEQRLGTDPDNADTDGDQLRDDLEVAGFLFGGQTWYSDPVNVDTNSDGRTDLYECWTAPPDALPSNTPCNLDTDGDGQPDLFDRDDDGDGVDDRVDLSPADHMPASGAFSGSSPFQMTLNDLEAGYVTFVDLQLRPTNPEHLTYAFSVLDWPSGDTKGQVQRVLDTTFSNSMSEEEIQKDPRSVNGDLRLIPMVEVNVQYKEGHTRNLPVKPGWTGTLTATTPLETWVNMDVVKDYGLTLRYADESGNLVIYAPLSLVSDQTGGASVAFTTRLPYQAMSSGDWGYAHQFRFVWALQMLVDHCKPVPDGEEAESWCLLPENRVEQIQIVHMYDDPWVLSGLDVREDHGLQMGIAFEDPAKDADKEDDRNLWALANGLDQSWIAARDCDTVDDNGNCVGDGKRDLTLTEIVNRFDNQSNGSIPADDERLWNIPKDALRIWRKDFAYQDLMAAVPMTHTKEILNEHFLVSGQPVTPAPTLMFLREEEYRSANLDSRSEVASWSGLALTVNLVATYVPTETLAAMNWAPYRYRDGAWEPYPIEEYVGVLDPRMAESFPVDLNDPDGQAISDGQVIMARGFYLGMVQGTQEIVQSGDLEPPGPGQSHDEKLKEESIKVAGNIVLTIVKLSAEQICDRFYQYLVREFLGTGDYFTRAGNWFKYLGNFNKPTSEAGKGGWIGWNKESGKVLSRFNRMSVATLIISTICAVTLFAISCAIDTPVIPYIQSGLLAAANTIRAVASAAKFISEWQTIKSGVALKSAFKTLLGKASAPWSAGVKGAFIVTIVIEAVIALGVFFYSWLSSDIKAGSLAWDQMLVETIAKIVIKTLLWALNFIPVIGKALYLIISAIDALVGFICKFISDEAKEKSQADEWLCGGISGALTKAWVWFYYGQHILVDLEDENRWQIGVPDFDLGDPAKGMAVGNSLYYQLTITNSIHLVKYPVDWKAVAYWWQYSDKNLQRSTFDYAMSGVDDLDLHSGLSLDDNEDEWEKGSVRDGKDTYYIARGVETEAPGAPLITAGINITNSVYIHEGYAVPTQECIGVGLIPICWIRESDGTIPANLGDSFPWDVFPEDLTKFHELVEVNGGYSLAWSQDSDPPFGRQKDADGDALLSAIDGGPDQDDSDWDADNDGLSDYFELQVGLKPDQVGGYDPDGDGLNDREELLLGTDPFKADSDGDGLNDRQERDGWEFAYGFDNAGNPKMTWVTSDPNMLDTDADTLTDFQEYNYRYNPRAVSDPHVLGFTARLSELLSSGTYTTSDGLVRSGDQLRYEAEVENNTFLSSAQGLYELRFPTDRLSGSVAPRTFQLYPQETMTLTGDLTVRSGIASGPADVTQNAGARITYALADSDYAQLVLHLEDPSTATTFADSSGNIPPHNGECSTATCPTRQVAGYMGSAVQFDATKQQVIKVPDVDISTGDFGVSFWFKTQTPDTRLFSTADDSINLTLSSGRVCMEVKVLEWTTVPCTGRAYADNQWHHLALTFENSLGANFYVDGRWVLGGYYSGTRSNPNPDSGVRLGYGTHSPFFYTGLLDDVVIYDRALTWQDVNMLFGRPLFSAHLDEPPDVTQFKEDGGLSGICLGTICPTAGQAGMVRQSAGFNGGQNISFPGPSISGEPFTLAAWVLPKLTGLNIFDTYPQGIAGRLTDGLYFSLPTLVRVGSGIQAVFGVEDGLVKMSTVPNVLTPNVWNHVLVTYGRNQDGKGQFNLYVNGVPKGEQVLADYALPLSFVDSGFNIGAAGYGVEADPDYPTIGFVGQIDEVIVYPYVLSAAQVEELYHYQADALHLTFDEPPGTYQFQDALRRASGSCPADLASCPSAGVSGRTGQAAYFDGANDFLDAGTNPAISGTGPVSLAAWVRTSAAKNQVIVQQRSAAVFNGEYMLSLTSAGMVRWYIYGNGGAAEFSLISSKAVNDGKWHHVAAVRELDGSARIYIDGIQDAYLAPSAIAPLVATNVYVGADTRDHAGYFEGYIDELHVVRRALTAGQVQELVNQAPQFLMHLEEPAGSYFFADDTEQDHEALCASNGCPVAGIKG
ncbi:MAG: LamG domain-containing protein, partial [Chloroflexota bacterium]